jgi:DNA-binding SARP family transcriptional activator/tetratricopeptide (TPR) repeat protein
MEFRVLGPVEIRAGDQLIDAGHARRRAVLAVLLLDLGRPVPAETLIDRVWGNDPPASVRNLLYGYVARLRTALASALDDAVTLSRGSGGYRLQADAEQLDLARFRRLVDEAAAADSDEQAAALLSDACGLWRGPALAGLNSLWLTAMRTTLELERHAAQLDLNDIRLRLGEHTALVGELTGQALATPADDRLTGQLMLALYRSGHPAEALRHYEHTRQRLAAELGTDPGPQLQALHQQILTADPALTGPTLTGPTLTGPTLAAAAGGRGSTMPIPRELPPDVAAFTGRSAELAALDRLLLTARSDTGEGTTAAVMCAVSGTAGVGKTALALHWAHRAARHFPDGQLHVNLRGYDPDQPVAATDALAGFLRSLGVPGTDIPPDELERAAHYRSLLAARRMLIVLDNAATVEQVRPLLPRHPACAVIVTSRDSLADLVARDGASRLDLNLLPLRDAVALLGDLIGDRASAEPTAATELAEQCARLPLALRVAAELAAARPTVPLGNLIAELNDEQRKLDLLHADGDPRTAVRAVLSWSYDRLGLDDARAFRLAGLHPGADFDAYALAALTRSRPDHARRELASLTRAHLVQVPSPARYSMHDLLRAYAGERAAAHDTAGQCQQALTRLFDYYLSAAAAAMDVLYPAEAHVRPHVPRADAAMPAMPGRADAGAWLDRERANLVAVVVHGTAHGWPRHAADLSWTLFRYLTGGSHLAEAGTIYSHALQSARRSADLAAEARALTGLGGIGFMNGHFRDAVGHYQAALECYVRCGDRAGQARALSGLGAMENQLHNPHAAADYQRLARAAYEDCEDRLGAAFALVSLADAEKQLGSYDQAAEHLQRALAVIREFDDPVREYDTLASIGDISLRRGQLALAADSFEQTVAICRRIDHPTGVATGLLGLGEVSLRQGDYPQAVTYLREALALARQIGGKHRQILTLRTLAEALDASGQPAAARAGLADALRLAAETGNTHQQASVHRDLADNHHAAGEDEEARRHWEQALDLFTELGAPEADVVRARLAAPSTDTSAG